MEADWEPDYGPSKFVPSWGATVTGARDYLVAYNVNLLGTKQQAHRIALNIREAGRGPKEVCVCVRARAHAIACVYVCVCTYVCVFAFPVRIYVPMHVCLL